MIASLTLGRLRHQTNIASGCQSPVVYGRCRISACVVRLPEGSRRGN